MQRAPAATSSDSEWIAYANAWAEWDPDQSSKSEILSLARAQDINALKRMLSRRVPFGTAGLRAAMGAGSAFMNSLVVLQTSQAVAIYFERLLLLWGTEEGRKLGLATNPHDAQPRAKRVVLGYDHRALGTLNSRTFAEFTAAAFLHRGFEVVLYRDICATPLVPFGIQRHNCIGGVMITASHNPKTDNGYKLYGYNGSQIISPHDTLITELIESHLQPWITYDLSSIYTHPKLLDFTEETENAYYAQLIESLSFVPPHAASSSNSTTSTKNDDGRFITYSAMHGVGTKFVKKAFAHLGLPELFITREHAEPDPTFPTVTFPNPEESIHVIRLAIMTAEAAQSTLVLANDPDADRLAVAERIVSYDEKKEIKLENWRMLTGNEIATLLADFVLRKYLEKNPGVDKSKIHMLSSTVSSTFLSVFAKQNGIQSGETLTGFKWLGNRMYDLEANGQIPLFAYEEAIGFCLAGIVRDKDGVSASVVFAQMAMELRASGKTCVQKLNELYGEYGHFISNNSYVKCYDPEIVAQIFERQRNNNGGYLEQLGGYKVTGVVDFTTGYCSFTEDRKSVLPLNCGGEMIRYYFSDPDLVFTLRTSGTEPKIKWYSEVRVNSAEKLSSEALKVHTDKLATLIRAFVDELTTPFEIVDGLVVRS